MLLALDTSQSVSGDRLRHDMTIRLDVEGHELTTAVGLARLGHTVSWLGRVSADEMGMRTLREDGARKVLAGLTSPEEVIRATLGDLE